MPEIPETALPKRVKAQLRKAHAATMQRAPLVGNAHAEELPLQSACQSRNAHIQTQSTQQIFPVAISEVFSPPRISQEPQKRKLTVGKAYDLLTGYNLQEHKDQQKMWRDLRADEPELVVCSPPCTPFTSIQELNWAKMPWIKAVNLVADGVENFNTAVTVCK